MFKLKRQNKHLASSSTTKSGEKFDFTFSNFQALQVPEGWDKLFVSIISVETGKTIAKSNKASVRNGTCQWMEALSESLWIPQDDSSNELEEILLKLVISMGSARSGILGESVVNMASYKRSNASSPVTLPLKKCNYGTVLQVQIQCLTSTEVRDQGSKFSNSDVEARENDHRDGANNSNENYEIHESLPRSLRSQSSQDLGFTSHPENLGSTETSYQASGSQRSFVSEEDSMRRGNLSPPNDISGVRYNVVGRQDEARSGNRIHEGIYPADDYFGSYQSSFNSRLTHSVDESQNYEEEHGQSSSVLIGTPSLTNVGSSRNLLEAAEDTIEELRNEARMWERNSQRLTLDLDILEERFLSQSKKQTNLEMELLTSYTVQDGLKKEMDQLRLLLEEVVLKETTSKRATCQLEDVIHGQRELEKELKFQKEANTHLAMQLGMSQESNIELLSVLSELEETIEKQKVEIEYLSKQQSRFSELEGSIEGHLEENRIFLLQSEQLQESERRLLVNVQLLEQELEAKSSESENARRSYEQSLLDIEQEYRYKLSVAGEDVVQLSENLTDPLTVKEREKSECSSGSSLDSMNEIKELKEIVQELEVNCSELTNENLELLCKLKELGRVSEEAQLDDSITSTELLKQIDLTFYNIKRSWYTIPFEVNGECESHYRNLVNSNNPVASKGWAESLCNFLIEVNKLLEARIGKCEEVLKSGELEMNLRERTIAEAKCQTVSFSLKVQELEGSNIELQAKLAELQEEMAAKASEVQVLESDILSKEEQMNLFKQSQMEIKTQVTGLEKERDLLQQNVDILVSESNLTSKCLDDLQTDLMVLRSSVESHVTVNGNLQRKLSEHEAGKEGLELHLFNVEEENVKLTECISGLEAQLRNVKDTNESIQLELENSKSVATALQDEIRRLIFDIEKDKTVQQEKLQNLQARLSEAQEECEYRKMAYQKSQASGQSLSETCSTLQKMNEELRKQNLELHENSKSMEIKLQDKIRRLTEEMDREITFLKENLQDMENQLRKAQEENECHKIAYQKSQTSVESLSENCSTLQKLNKDLTEQNLELHENSKFVATGLQDEVTRLTLEMETEKNIVEEKLQDMENRQLEVQEQCGHLKIAYQKSQTSIESLSENCSTLQKLNKDLTEQNLELRENSKFVVTGLQDEVTRLTLEMETEKNILEEKLQDMENRQLEVQEQCGHLKIAYQKSQASGESLSQRCSTLHKLNEELRKQNMELHENSKSFAISIQDEIRRTTVEMETVNNFLQEKLLDMENRLSEAEQKCGYHKMSYRKLQASVLNLSENCNTLQKIKEDLTKQILDLNENSKSVAMGLQDEIRRLTVEMEAEKVVQQEKLQDMDNKLSEAQEECEYQKMTNQKSQKSSMDLSKKCNKLQEINEESRKKIKDLHERCTFLETNLRESQQNLSASSQITEKLEEKLSSILEEFAIKEKSLTSKLDVLLQENREQKQKLIRKETLLNQMYMEKTAEVGNLQREVELLINQISATNDERDRIASEAVNEVSKLHSDNEKLNCVLQEVMSRAKVTEDELDGVRTEYKTRVQDLISELAASKQSHADHEIILKRLTSYRSSQEKLKTSVNDLELKLTVSEYERQQLIIEIASLKGQIRNLGHYQENSASLKQKLEEYKLEKEKLEALLHSLSVDNDNLKAEISSLNENYSSLQKVMTEFEDCKHKRIALEEKLCHMEHDLLEKKASVADDEELRNELGRMKRVNKQYKRTILQIEVEKDELLKRVQTCDKNLKLMEAEHQDRSRTGKNNTLGEDFIAKVQLLEDELAEALEANNRYKLQLQSIFSDGLQSHLGAPRKSVSGSDVAANERYERTKSSLETEIVDLRDRYFQMSLRYAEVEAQREDLVMKLKAHSNGKRLS
ncbi:hypothetical protein POM88_002966 [Heracleum sosnowskyi]|uniref:C2 NT-type domain-containing protein n=1 Tax=Heracleum sosnowskyi TaxID=360622 RepID=A0AAD8JIP2_9APIA|nr:hypothetical protein POM88_002966 [Heracleum sosnowskyi]